MCPSLTCVFSPCCRTSRLGRASYLPPSLRGSVMSATLSDDGSMDDIDAAGDDSLSNTASDQSLQQQQQPGDV